MPATIPSSQIASVFTTAIVSHYDEVLKARPTGWFRSMFTEKTTPVRYPSIDVRRGTEKVAIDVVRGHQGRRTQITKGTQKVFDPFYYNYYFDATELDAYWRLFGSQSASLNLLTEAANGVAVQNMANQDLIDRAIEVHCAEIMEFGTLTSFQDGSQIDFKRKSASFQDAGAGSYWATSGISPYQNIEDDCNWIRWNGKYTGGVFNLTMGQTAYKDFLDNTVVKGRNDLKMWKLDDLVAPDRNVQGQTYHGTISAGAYIVHIWMYPQFYEHPTTGAQTAYMNAKKYVLTPAKTDFEILFGAIPQLVTPGASTLSLVEAKYMMNDYIDPKRKSHEFHIESAPIPVPTAIDTIVTRKVVA